MAAPPTYSAYSLPAHLMKSRMMHPDPFAGAVSYQELQSPQVIPSSKTVFIEQSPQVIPSSKTVFIEEGLDSQSVSDEEEEARITTRYEDYMQAARKRLASEPDGNLYRGWAVGIQKGNRQRFLTVLVVCVQVIGPVVMCTWGAIELTRTGQTQDFWTFFNPDCASFSDTDLAVCGKPLNASLVILNKVLGSALMLVLYLNGDSILDRMDRQTDRLRELYPNLKKGWMFLDSFCNSWCVMISAFATPLLVFASYEAKDLVLDAFGLLFLQSIDDYSTSVEFGIETSDFDELIDLREIELAREQTTSLIQKDSSSSVGTGDTRETSADSFVKHVLFGDVFFTIARFVNQIVGCFAIPTFLLVQWYPADAPSQCLCPSADKSKSRWDLLFMFFSGQAIGVALIGIACILLNNMCYSWKYIIKRDQDCDWLSILWQVICCGRGNPLQHDKDRDDDDL